MRCSLWWMLFAMCLIVTAITKNAAEMLTQELLEVTVVETTTPTPYATDAETLTTTTTTTPTPYATDAETLTTTTTTPTPTPYATDAETLTTTTSSTKDAETTTVSVITVDVPAWRDTTTTATTTITTGTLKDKRRSKNELHNRIVRLTNELNRAVAELTIAQHREEQMAALEKERFGYLQTIELKLVLLVDNAINAKAELTDDTNREQRLLSVNRLKDRSSRRLQVIRRLLFGSRVGLAHMEGAKGLNACDPNRNTQIQQQKPSEQR